MFTRSIVATAACLAAALAATPAGSQTPAPFDAACTATPQPAFCAAVRGVRAQGWPAQTRSEVMATHGMVVTSQPLAAQAGLQVLRQGGNAVDAAVATAGVLSLVEPMSVGVASDMFALIYIARDHRVYVLNSSGTAPSGATLAHLNELGYHAGIWAASNSLAGWRFSSGMYQEASTTRTSFR
jgi:gamma-glutamyltranspeptidase/glutathione hydrolase